MKVMVMRLCYITATRALQLCSVPLDVAYSLQSLRSALGESASYTARALQNSRRLLALYLAGSTKPPETFASGNSSCSVFVKIYYGEGKKSQTVADGAIFG